MRGVRVAAAVEEAEEVVVVAAVERRPAPDVTPWRSLPQSVCHPWEGQTVLHEKFGTP